MAMTETRTEAAPARTVVMPPAPEPPPRDVTKKPPSPTQLPSIIVGVVIAAVAGLPIWYLVRPQPLLVQGEVDATRFDIAARVDGRVAEIPVVRGQDVAAGAVLVRGREKSDLVIVAMKPAITGFAREYSGSLIVLPSSFLDDHRPIIFASVMKHRLPVVYGFRHLVSSGGLMSYGMDLTDLYRRAASYVDRILKGAKAADLPVQQPTKFELVINLKAARAIGLELPPTLLARADEVIE
jgi:hypothetical protein